MYIHGSFVNKSGEEVAVYIVTNKDRSIEKEIGTEESGFLFTDNPVEVAAEINDTFDHLIRQSASIRFLARDYAPDFFNTSCRDAIVNIYKGDECVFAGFIEPQAYSQPYNELYDEIELNCIDALSALQYSKFKNIGSLGVIYDIVKSEAVQQTFYSILMGILEGVTDAIDIVGGHSVKYLYDSSKGVDDVQNHQHTIFKDISISELLFLGNEEDDVWQQDEVLGEIMKYLNLHIEQEGFTFYIFSWDTIKNNKPINWYSLRDNKVLEALERKTVKISTDIVSDCDTNISIGEVYNQLFLTCKFEDMENIIESPLDGDLLDSPYSNYQKYCTELSSDGKTKASYTAFYNITHEQKTDYSGAVSTDWYVRIMRNSMWAFPYPGGNDLIEDFCWDGVRQHLLPDYLAMAPGAAIIAFGSNKKNISNNDNSPTPKINMTNYLVVSINGNEVDNDETKTYPNEESIKKHIPYAVYNGNSAGGVFSPADNKTINYIVISGKVILNPIMHMTDTYKNIHETTSKDWWTSQGFPMKYYRSTVPSRTNGDGRYYTRLYWQADKVTDDPTWNEYSSSPGFVPFTNEGPQEYEFKYSAIGDGGDNISKIAVLACMLIIGDKCVVEVGSTGKPDDFVWRTYKTLEQCANEDEYYQQCFTIGFDPKIGDKLIGTEFNLQNNIDYTMGVDAEGIAIPIKMDDKVKGPVKFMILGPVNSTWDVITRRHPTFFRHTKWSSSTIPLLAHVSSIMIGEFEVKLYSNNRLVNNYKDNDVIYMSDTKETFVNKKDDIEFKICSALTSAECQELGVKNGVKMSTPLNVLSGTGLLTIYDYNTKETAKAEQFYVDSYYREYHSPHILMEQNLIDKDGIASIFNFYIHPAMPGKTFFVQGISRNFIESTAGLKLKEIGV